MVIGFSTGSLARGDFSRGLQMAVDCDCQAIELSALRESELQPLLEWVGSPDSSSLERFQYVSIHAPGMLERYSEDQVIEILHIFARRQWPVIVHPDVIRDFGRWGSLGSALCLENMDRRKTTGRTVAELGYLFGRLPESQFCFDIGHARQIDPTMYEAHQMLMQFRERVRQVHVSLVNSESGHEPLNYESLVAFARVTRLLPQNVPLILETPVMGHQMGGEIEKVRRLVGCAA